jgi:hydrogenase expression/formation protein HypE
VGVVAGDTKVVERGKGDGIFLVSAGVGRLRSGYPREDRGPRAGDAILVSGPIGDHGAVILSVRFGLRLPSALQSDCAPVTGLVEGLFDAGVAPLFLRDPTRGGLGGVLSDLAREDDSDPDLGVEIDEAAVPVRAPVAAVCEIAGVDPLQLACEGRVVAVVEEDQAEQALAAWRFLPAGAQAARIGTLVRDHPGRVVLRTRYGGARLFLRPAADALPRIC